MRKVGSARKRPAGGIRWDEHNLQENEVIKASISKTKIDEPKTPYHGPLGDQHMEEADDGLQPLELDANHHQHQPEPLGGGPAGAVSSKGVLTDTAAAETEPQTATSPHQAEACPEARGADCLIQPSGISDSVQHSHSQGLHAHFESALQQSADAVPNPESRSGFSSDSECRASLTGGSDTDSNEEEARRKFEQRRRAHYNMRAALHRARLLLSEDGEGDPEKDSEGAACLSSNKCMEDESRTTES